MNKFKEVPEGYRGNLDTIIRAAKNGDLCVMSALDNDGDQAYLLCAAHIKYGEVHITPLALMLDNPYADYRIAYEEEV